MAYELCLLFRVSNIPVLTLYHLKSLFNEVQLNSRIFVCIPVCPVLKEVTQHPAPAILIIWTLTKVQWVSCNQACHHPKNS